GGAAEIQHVTSTPSPKPEPKVRQHVQAAHPPAVTPVTPDPAQATPPAETAATPPTTDTPAAPAETVTVPPQTSQPGTTGGTASTLPLGKRKHHHGNNIANTDKGGTTAPQTGPVTTGVEPSTTPCDADGDGVADPGAPATCATATTPTTGVSQPTT